MSHGKELFYKAANETMVEYFQKTSLNGFGLLYYIRRRKYQRTFWFMFILLGIGFATYVVFFTLYNFLQKPTVTSLDSQPNEIWDIPYPAMALCSVNKLSRRAVETYVQEIMHKQPIQNQQYWLEKMHLFAGLFDAATVEVNQFDAATQFQNQLDKLIENSTGSAFFNITEMLSKLAPTCTDLLLKCRLSDSVKDCTELFELHATAMGYCCIFNYQRAAANESFYPLMYPNGTGIEMGLTVLLNTSKVDYFYNGHSTSGFILQIFAPNNFPDASTGELQELFISPNADIEVELSIVDQVAAEEVRQFSVQKRGCYFLDEHFATYGLAYSHAECLTKCKINNLMHLCDCIPYYTPIDFIDWNASVTYCTLTQVECLQRYEIALKTYKPAIIPEHLQQDLQESISCLQCLPLCSYHQYNYRKIATSLKDTLFDTQNKKFFSASQFDMKLLPNTSVSLVKIYFPTAHVLGYDQNASNNWYQILSNIGGVIGICLGCSLISGFEIIYFLTFRLFEIFRKQRKIMH